MLGDPHLRKLRTQCTATDLLVYIDLGTQMVLAADSERQPLQEQLNALAATTSDIFLGPDAEMIRGSLGWQGTISRAILHDGSSLSAFQRAQGTTDEAVCAIGDVAADTAALLMTAEKSLSALSHVDD